MRIHTGFSLVLTVLICLISVSALAQTVTVTDADSGAALAGVQITAGGRTVVTADNGTADLGAFTGSRSMVFRLDGYQRHIATFADLEKAGFAVSLKPVVFSGAVTVTGVTRREQEREDVPQRTISISREEVALQNPQTAADLLGASGEVYIQKSQLAGGSPMMRGFATNRVLLVVDGVRMNTAMFREGNVQNVISLDPQALDHTDVVFGPGSVIYGSDAIGGVMSFATMAPVLSAVDAPLVAAHGSVRASSANEEKSGHLDFSYGSRNWGSLTSVSYADFGDLRMGGNGPDEYLRPSFVQSRNGVDTIVPNPEMEVQTPSNYTQANIMQKFRFVPAEDLQVDYGFHYSTTSNLPRYDRLIEVRNGTLRYAEWYYGPQDWMMHSLAVRSTGSTPLYDSAVVTVAFQQFLESRNDRKLNEAVRRRQAETLDAWSMNIDLDRSLDKRQTLYYGFETVYDRVHSEGSVRTLATGVDEPYATRYPDGATWTSLATYLDYDNRITEQVTVTAGARYNRITMKAKFNDTFYDFPVDSLDNENDAFTGSVGIIYRPSEALRLALNLSTGFRAPNIDDAGKVFESAPGEVVVPNPDLKPEYARSVETTIGYRFGSFADLEATAFYTRLDDAMVRRDATFNGQEFILYAGELSRVQSLQNAYEAEAYGLQIAGQAALSSALSLRGDYTWMRGETDAGEALRHVSPPFGRVALDWVHGPFTLDASLTFNQEIPANRMAPSEQDKPQFYRLDADGRVYCPGWTTISLKGIWSISAKLSLTAGIENISDERYRPYSSGIVAPGRNVIIGLRWVY